MGFKIMCILLLFCTACFSPALAQFPTNPPETDSVQEEHKPGAGFSLIKHANGSLRISPYVTTRYLNQKAIHDTYTNTFGRTFILDKRNDLQFQKVVLYFKGWIASPDFRYMLYTWTSNANQGQGAQVVISGSLQYKLSKYLDLGTGVGGLPTSRSLFGNWPFWLRQDARPMAEEFFRGSFTTGIWAQGEITKGLYYKTMLGNNLSQLGVDAGQLDNGFDTWSTALWWTTRDYGRQATMGDFEKHEKLATILGGAFTRSNETRQSQPDSDDPENSQIRLSDGTGVFNLNAFADSTQVLAAKYQMTSLNGGFKYRGFSLDAEYYWRWVSDFKVFGEIPVSNLFDEGFYIQASGMLIDKTLQLYSTGSYINGEYGKPWEITAGLNWYVLKNRILRLNPEVIFVHQTPVGYFSYPTVVGAKGTIFMANLELFY